VELFSTGEGPGIRTGGVGAKARGVSFIAHVADEEVFFGKPVVKVSFEGAKLHHAGAEAVSDEDDAGAFFELEGRGGGREDGQDQEEGAFHRPKRVER